MTISDHVDFQFQITMYPEFDIIYPDRDVDDYLHVIQSHLPDRPPYKGRRYDAVEFRKKQAEERASKSG